MAEIQNESRSPSQGVSRAAFPEALGSVSLPLPLLETPLCLGSWLPLLFKERNGTVLTSASAVTSPPLILTLLPPSFTSKESYLHQTDLDSLAGSLHPHIPGRAPPAKPSLLCRPQRPGFLGLGCGCGIFLPPRIPIPPTLAPSFSPLNESLFSTVFSPLSMKTYFRMSH